MAEKTIPLLPCQTIQPVIDFYTALGFEVTFLQKSPNPFAVVERGDIGLQFFGMKKYEPSESYSTCYILTDDVDRLYEAFRAGLKAAYGKIPSRGIPRIGPLKDMSYGVRQFLMTDPGGNCVRVGQPTSEDQHHRPAPKETFARALHNATLFADSKEDPAGAAKIIDRVLGLEDERPTPVTARTPPRPARRRGRAARRRDDGGVRAERGPPRSNSAMRNGSRSATTWRGYRT